LQNKTWCMILEAGYMARVVMHCKYQIHNISSVLRMICGVLLFEAGAEQGLSHGWFRR
jgi:hypothetical protein